MSKSNINKILKQLRAKERAIKRRSFQALNDGADILKNEIVLSLQTVSPGKKYPRGKNKYHVASKAGDAPNIDHGGLVGSIQKKAISEDEVEVGSYNVSYANDLEFGTSKIEARPFIKPAFDKHVEGIKKHIRKSFK